MTVPVVNAVASVDRAFLFIFGISALILVGIACAMVYFVWRYNAKRHPVPADFDGNLTAEIIWIVVPTALVMAMFYYGWTSYTDLRTVPPGSLPVKVTARMWSWSFEYPGGKTSKELVAPVGRPVALTLSSTDVIHGFFAPAFRIKIDTVPGMTTHAWFQAEKKGDYDVFCSVYCGLQHANMLTKIKAVSEDDFAAWLAEKPGESGAAKARALLDQHGCLGCHSLDGTVLVGPSLKDMKGRSVVLVAPDGAERTVTVDQAYLEKAVLGDKGGVVKGFDPVMPNFTGQIPEDQVRAMARFLLDGDPLNQPQVPTPEAGAAVAEREGCVGCHSTDGTVVVGPSFKGLFGSHTTVLMQGHEHPRVVDHDYVLEVLADPSRQPVKGFDPVMPAYPNLTAPDQESLVAYLKSLAGGGK